MFTKNDKAKILERFPKKEEKIFVSSILDKAYVFEKDEKIKYTNFLNLYEMSIATDVLNALKISYKIFSPNEFANKKIIFFTPEYVMLDDDFFSNYVSVIKVIPNVKNKLAHKDYMGSIYSLGIKKEMIGDIYANEECAYIYCMKSVEEYIFSNMFSIGNNEVKLELLKIDNKELSDICPNFVKKECIVSSKRADAVLADVYNISRNETKEKIVKGDLYINDRLCINPSEVLNNGDIVSFKRCGKLKIGQDTRTTKSGNIVVEAYKFC